MPIQVLVADDDPHIHELLDRILVNESSGYRIFHARTPEDAIQLARSESFALALVDLHFAGSELNGFDLLDQLRELDPFLELVVLSSSSRFDDMRGAMRAGAGDYLAKGFGKGEILHALASGLERRRWKRMERRERARQDEVKDRLVGSSNAMQSMREKISRFAPAQVSVLIQGETGTGKELVAKSLHALGKDSAAPFVAVNCAALPASTIDSFFFGHEKSAFTGADRAKPGIFEEAEGGTLFLDEVNSLPLELQGRLLRVLQEKRARRLGGCREIPVSFRVVTASNQPLEELVRKGLFREDLFFRLSVLRLELPSLRDRKEDLKELIAALLPARNLSEALRKLLEEHSWPGNVRELRNVLQAMDVMAVAGEVLEPAHLPEHALRSFAQCIPVEKDEPVEDLESLVNERENREREFLSRAYRSAGGNVSRMARILGLDRSHLHQKLVKMAIHQPRSS